MTLPRRAPIREQIDEATLHPDLHVYDVTLRDGAQMPGVEFTAAAEREIAGVLDDLGVRYVEAGYPASSPADGETIERVADAVSDATVTALAKADAEEIDAVLATDVESISVFVAGSDVHLEEKWGLTPTEAVERAREGVRYAADHGLEVRFAVVDATRTPLDRLQRFATAAAAGGASFFGVSDTVGLLTPRDSRALVEWACEQTDLSISVHNHDDLGMAAANTLSAAEAGAAQLHTTVTGIGANGGNAPLAPTATTLRVRHERDVVDTTGLSDAASLVADRAGVDLPAHAAVVGDNGFRYGSAPRVAGVTSDPETYEAYPPALVGADRRIDDD